MSYNMSVGIGQKRLKKIAVTLDSSRELDPSDKAFLVNALLQISYGDDAETTLEVKAKKGERKSRHSWTTKQNKTMAMGWMEVAISQKEDGGLGLTIKNAAEKLNKGWGKRFFSVETLIRYWNDHKDNPGPEFKISDYD